MNRAPTSPTAGSCFHSWPLVRKGVRTSEIACPYFESSHAAAVGTGDPPGPRHVVATGESP